MKLSQIKKYRKRPKLLPQLVYDNPLLIIGLDLPFVVVGATSLKNAAAFSIEMLFIHLVTMIVGWLIVKKLKIWQRVYVTTTVAMAMMILSRELVLYIIPDIDNHAGMYLFLMGVNGVTLFQANFLSKKAKLKQVVSSSLLNILVFTLTMFGVSFLREYFGNGTLWGIKVPSFVKMEGLRFPFFGFIMVGFLLAMYRFLNKKLATFVILEKARKQYSRTAKTVEE